MEEQGPPNPIVKHAVSSNLPRQARARIGATTDPVPEGKQVDASPELHFPMEPASHDVERSNPKSPSDMGLTERDSHMKELEKRHPDYNEGVRNRKDVWDWTRQGSGTASNKRMSPRHRTNDFNASGRGHNKHQDSVTRGGQ